MVRGKFSFCQRCRRKVQHYQEKRFICMIKGCTDFSAKGLWTCYDHTCDHCYRERVKAVISRKPFYTLLNCLKSIGIVLPKDILRILYSAWKEPFIYSCFFVAQAHYNIPNKLISIMTREKLINEKLLCPMRHEISQICQSDDSESPDEYQRSENCLTHDASYWGDYATSRLCVNCFERNQCEYPSCYNLKIPPSKSCFFHRKYSVEYKAKAPILLS